MGDHEEKERKRENTQVENTVFLNDFALTYGLSDRTTLSVSLPFLIARRNGPNRDFPGERYMQNVEGIGDLIVTARRWMMDPAENPDRNVSLGIGAKLPTGKPDSTYTRKVLNEDDEVVTEIRTADQSVQAGDGGFGIVLDLSAFRTFGSWTPYLAGTYVLNPEGTNGVRTFRSRESEAVMSIPDQYVARTGVLWTPPDGGPSFGLGGRIEGSPVEDVVGSSDGFRRPGYAVSVEPSLSWGSGKSIFNLSMPWAVYRNRLRSVPDREEPGRHGDAAFADWLLLFGWTYRF